MDKQSCFNEIKKVSTVDQIIQDITDALINRRLLPGQKIPTEAEMTEAFHVSRNSVREAIKALVAMGILEIRRPEGTFVVDKFSNKMLNPILYSLILEADNNKSLIELRKYMDSSCLRLAIERATEEDIEEIKKSYLKLKKLLDNNMLDANNILNADIEIHDMIGKASHNALMRRIDYLVGMLSRSYRIRATEYLLRNGKKNFILDTHTTEIDMIINHDSNNVENIIETSFEYWEKALNEDPVMRSDN